MAFKNYSTTFTYTTLTGWTQSTTTSTEYYYATDAKHKPLVVTEDGSELTEGTLGSLAIGEWAWGDQDSLGYDTVYARVTGDVDPDTLTMKGSIASTLATAGTGKTLGIMSVEQVSTEASDAKNVKLIRTDSSDTKQIEIINSVPANDYVVLDHAIVLEEGDKLKVMCDTELITVCLNANEV